MYRGSNAIRILVFAGVLQLGYVAKLLWFWLIMHKYWAICPRVPLHLFKSLIPLQIHLTPPIFHIISQNAGELSLHIDQLVILSLMHLGCKAVQHLCLGNCTRITGIKYGFCTPVVGCVSPLKVTYTLYAWASQSMPHTFMQGFCDVSACNEV